jgi:hypothetical protein
MCCSCVTDVFSAASSYFPRCRLEETAAEVLAAFVPQFYLGAKANVKFRARSCSARNCPMPTLLAALAEAAGARLR